VLIGFRVNQWELVHTQVIGRNDHAIPELDAYY
jgi:hypothetical protein